MKRSASDNRLSARRRLAGLTLAAGLYAALAGGSLNPNQDAALWAAPGRNPAESRPMYYRVRRGDTLSHIAQRFRVPLATLARMNGMQPDAALPAGRRLKVGVNRARSAARAAEPPAIGQRTVERNGTSLILPLNWAPPPPARRRFQSAQFQLEIFARSFGQGEAAYLELRPPARAAEFAPGSAFTVLFAGSALPLTRTARGYTALFGFAPDLRPGPQRIEVNVEQGGRTARYGYNLAVRSTPFRVSVARINVGPPERRRPADPPDPEQIERLRQEGLRKARAFASVSPDYFASRLAHPRDFHKITSPFYTLRRTNRFYYRNRRRIADGSSQYRHRGVDLRGRTGDPIYAMADGRVLLAERMHLEGNFVLVDHGNKVFTGYMHLSDMHVYSGQTVTAGQQLGRAGGTGRVTGPHLHMSLWIRGTPFDALSLLSLPIQR